MDILFRIKRVSCAGRSAPRRMPGRRGASHARTKRAGHVRLIARANVRRRATPPTPETCSWTEGAPKALAPLQPYLSDEMP